MNNHFFKMKNAKWITVLTFYFIACGFTYVFIQFPNFIKLFWVNVVGINTPFNWNHGIGLFLAAIICYQIFRGTSQTTFLGNKPLKSIFFTSIFLAIYTSFGIPNNHGINPHLWAFLFCLSTLIYDIFEETAWRGFLHDSLGTTAGWFKGMITGLLWGLWHLLIFDNFNQFGGLHIFLIMAIIISIIMAYATKRTNSILIAASIHALLINKDIYVTIICSSIWLLMILFWKKDNFITRKKLSLVDNGN